MQTAFATASQNQLKQWARLTYAKFRLEDALFLAEGVKVVEELFKSDWRPEALLVLPEKAAFWEKLIAKAIDSVPVYGLTRAEWKKLSQDKEPEGILAVVQRKSPPSPASLLQSGTGHLLICHEIANPQNLGALARTARWFGFSSILLSPNSVESTNPKVIRASMGSIFHLDVLPDVDLQTLLPEIAKSHVLIGSDVREGVSPHPPG
ncbi:MAG: TrmH family RNA methyltransferase, partial [Smithellaceae bacterium]